MYGTNKKGSSKMTLEEINEAYRKAVENGDIHEARYYHNLFGAIQFDKNGRGYDPAEFGGWNHGKS